MGCLRKILNFGALILGLALHAAPSFAESEEPDTFRVVGVPAGHSLVLRSGPGLLYPIAGALPANTTGLKNLGCKGGLTFAEWEHANARERAIGVEKRWCRVRHGKETGWARVRSLREDAAEHPR